MAKKKTADVEEEYVYSWQRKDDLGEVRHDFDAIVSSSELRDLRTLPDMPQNGSV